MKKRIRLRKKYSFVKNSIMRKSHKIILIIFLLMVMIFISFRFINKKVSPIFTDYAEIELSKLSNLIINKAVSKQLVENTSVENLFIITKENSGEIRTIDFNPIVVNKFLSTTTNSIQLSLKQIEEGNIDLLELPDDVLISYNKDKLKKGIVYEIPSGVILGNSLFSNLGPKIPVKFSLMGEISSTIKTKITNYGINNAMIEVNLHIRIEEMAILPFVSKRIKVENSIPIAIKMIEGNIPNYYFNGMDRESTSFALPTS